MRGRIGMSIALALVGLAGVSSAKACDVVSASASCLYQPGCGSNGIHVTWTTSGCTDNDRFRIEINCGGTWSTIATNVASPWAACVADLPAGGFSGCRYRVTDMNGGASATTSPVVCN